jgi:hypothetical protein
MQSSDQNRERSAFGSQTDLTQQLPLSHAFRQLRPGLSLAASLLHPIFLDYGYYYTHYAGDKDVALDRILLSSIYTLPPIPNQDNPAKSPSSPKPKALLPALVSRIGTPPPFRSTPILPSPLYPPPSPIEAVDLEVARGTAFSEVIPFIIMSLITRTTLPLTHFRSPLLLSPPTFPTITMVNKITPPSPCRSKMISRNNPRLLIIRLPTTLKHP